MLWSKQYYYFDLEQWLSEHKSHPLTEGAASRRAEHRVVPHAQRRHHLDAGQVGIPVVRRVGSGVPHDVAGAGRLRLREGAAAADAAQPLLPPERPDSGVRVELQRREPAGARLGDAVPVQDGADAGPRRHALPGAVVPGADAQLQLVGEPQGSGGPQRLCRRVPRSRQHRRLRSQRRAPDRRLARTGGRHGMDGVLLPVHAGDRADPVRVRRDVRGGRLQVRPALHVDRLRDGPDRRQPRRDVGRGGRLLLRPAAAAGRALAAAEGAVDGRSAAAVRVDGVRRQRRGALSEADGDDRAVPEAPSGAAVAGGADRRGVHRLQGAPAAVDPQQEEAGARARVPARRERVPRTVRHPLALAVSPGSSVQVLGRAPGVHRSVPAGGVEHRNVRRQLELARSRLDAGQRPHRSRAAQPVRVLRRRLHRGVSDRVRPADEPVRGRGGDHAAAGQHVPARQRRAAPRLRRHRRSSRTTRTGAT